MNKFWILFIKLFSFLYNPNRIISCFLQIVSSILIKRSNNSIRKYNFRYRSISMTNTIEETVDQSLTVTENNFNDDSSKISVQQDDEQSSFSSFQEQTKQLYEPCSFCSTQNLNSSKFGIREDSSKKLHDKDKGETQFSETINICNFKPTRNGITQAINPHSQRENRMCNEANNDKQWPLLYLEKFNITDIKFIEWENNLEVPFSIPSNTNAQIDDVINVEKAVINNKEIRDKDNFEETYNCDMGQTFISGSNPGNSIHQTDQRIFFECQKQELGLSDQSLCSVIKKERTSILTQNLNTLSERGNGSIEHTKDANLNLLSSNFGDVSMNRDLLVENEKYLTNFFDETKGSSSIDLITWEMPGEKFEFQSNQIENKEMVKKLDEMSDLKAEVYESISEQNKSDGTHLNGTKQIVNQENVLGSCDVKNNMSSNVLRVDKVSKDDINAPQIDVNETIKKLPKSENVSSKPFDKMSSQFFLTIGDYDSDETGNKQLENKCKNNNETQNHNTMMLGLCSDCVPVQSNEEVKNAQDIRPLSKSPHSPAPFIDRHGSRKPRNANRRRARKNNTLKKSTKVSNKRVTFSEQINFFSYNPDHSVFETFYGPLEKENDAKQTTRVPEKTSEATIGDVANKKSEEGSSKLSETLAKTDNQSTEIQNRPTTSEETPSEIQRSLNKMEEPLVNVGKTMFYENMGFISDYISSGLFEIDCIDDADATTDFEEDGTEKTCLIDGKVIRSYHRKLSDMKRQTEFKAKKWFKNSSMSLKRLAYKNLKPTSNK